MCSGKTMGKVYYKGGEQGCKGSIVEYVWRGRVEV
jgi:hypothetical protein